MEQLILQKLNDSHIGLIEDFRAELLSSGDAMEGCGSLKDLDALAWLRQCMEISSPFTCPADQVVTSQFVCLRCVDQKLLGIIKVRHFLNDFLEKYVGHIGYSIRPSERKKGYGTWMLKAVLPYCKEIALTQVLVCCELGNDASRRTILSAGGIFDKQDYSPDEDIYLERYWIKT